MRTTKVGVRGRTAAVILTLRRLTLRRLTLRRLLSQVRGQTGQHARELRFQFRHNRQGFLQRIPPAHDLQLQGQFGGGRISEVAQRAFECMCRPMQRVGISLSEALSDRR